MGDRRGFTLVELLVVAVLGSLILVATYNVLITNQRTYTVNAARVQGQQTVRAGMDLLFGELREISPSGGDLLRMRDDSVTIRVMRASALLCDSVSGAVTGNPPWQVVSMGDTLEDGDSVFVFAEHDPASSADDIWVVTTVTVRDSALCGGRAGQEVLFTGGGMPPGPDTPSVGGMVRAFVTYTYGLGTWNGEPYLIRARVPGGAAVPLVGPLRAGDGVGFEYLDGAGNATNVAADVRQILVTLRTEHEARDFQGNVVVDSLRTRVYTRN